MDWKVVNGHSKDCAAMAAVGRGDWDSPWCLLGYDYKGDKGHFWGDRFGRRNGQTTKWLRARCSDPGCDARIIVPEHEIYEEAPLA